MDVNMANEKAFADAFSRMLGKETSESEKVKAKIVAEAYPGSGGAIVRISGRPVDTLALVCGIIDGVYNAIGEIEDEKAANAMRITMHMSILKTLRETFERSEG